MPLLDDRDRLLLVGNAAYPHVWMFLQESTSTATYIQTSQKLQKLGIKYDGCIVSHGPVLLSNDLIDRLIHCAKKIDPKKSALFEPPLADAGKGIICFEDFESLKECLKMETLDLATQPFYAVNLDISDFSKFSFVSIVYVEKKI